MISAGLAVEGHAHGLGLPGHHPYMTYPEPWRGAIPPKPAEFLRPAPKPLNTSRYNGTPSAAAALNGARLVPQTANSPRSVSKYPSPPNAATPGPVNLAQIKDEGGGNEDLTHTTYASGAAAAAVAYSRLYAPPATFPPMHYQSSLPGPYGALYPPPYTPMIRPNFVQPPPLSPLETYSPPSAATSTSPRTFATPPVTYSSTSVPVTATASPLAHVKPGQSVLRDKRSAPGFKVPSGKEGSLKHRILTRPPGESNASHGVIAKRRSAGNTLSPPSTPTKPALNTNNNTVPGNFTKGSLIQLATGELRRVEDMRTEDFVLSAEKSPELRLAESTVVRIEENMTTGTCTITLSYNQNRTQVEFEATLEHPFFVYGQGWASYNPERTLHCYGLKVHRLQVGDILVSLTPRETVTVHAMSKSSTITTTATTTAMTARQVSRVNATANISGERHQVDKTLLPPPAPISRTAEPLDVSSSSRKRRWSAPDQICDDDEQAIRKHKE